MSVMFACHLVLRVLEITPASNALVPCAGDNTQRSLFRRQPLGPLQVRNDRLLLSLLQSRCGQFSHSRLAAAPVVQWSLPGPLFQSSWNPPAHVTVLLIDFCNGFGSLLHFLLALRCRCAAVCVEHNKEFAEVAQASFPQSVHLKCVGKLDPEAFVGVLARRSSWCSSGEVRRVKATLSGAQA